MSQSSGQSIVRERLVTRDAKDRPAGLASFLSFSER